jgi:hypothetical protein
MASPTNEWEDNIKLNLQETGWEYVEWIDVAQDREKWRAVVKFWDS